MKEEILGYSKDQSFDLGRLTVTFNFEELKDEELNYHFTDLGFDGVWSCLTKLSLIALKAQSLPLELNLNWALSNQRFSCPICRRSKLEIILKSQQRVLAELHIDHDHLFDWLKLKLKKISFPLGCHELAFRHARYLPLIMCSSCNKIDSQIKLMIPSVDKFFSFSPAEKKACLKKVRKKSHVVDLKKAEEIWSRQKDLFKQKKEDLELDIHDLSEKEKGLWFDYRKLIINKKKNKFFDYTQKISGQNTSFQSFIKRSTSKSSTMII